ncbi:MAG: lactate utilization protein [Candidatus Thiodiazotropha sp. (ex Myrtea sp. 'scaly one' KF741663)]|nr:lactate utilization protein [Candidatus Thiodiazotropha sp. (ex Myrtea sp. 'scaly one' KF741663)]
MNESRRQILDRLRAVSREEGGVLQRRVDRRVWNQDEKVQRFAECMSAVRAEVYRTSEVSWVNDLQRILKSKGAGNLLYAPAKAHGKLLREDLSSSGIELVPYDLEVERWKRRLFEQMDASITGCRGAIAETGSLILWPDEDEPRLLSLIPPIHCVLLRAEQIYSTFSEAIDIQGWADGMPTNALLISGPSKSADIAQVLAYGVHGPKSLVILIIP